MAFVTVAISQPNASAGTIKIKSAVADPRITRKAGPNPRVAASLKIVIVTGPTARAAPAPRSAASQSISPIAGPSAIGLTPLVRGRHRRWCRRRRRRAPRRGDRPDHGGGGHVLDRL